MIIRNVKFLYSYNKNNVLVKNSKSLTKIWHYFQN